MHSPSSALSTIWLFMTLHISDVENNTLLLTPYASQLGLLSDHFDLRFLQENDLITNTATGRGVVYFFTLGQQQLVLRHYKRGGLVAKISTDKFLFNSIANTRCFEELHVLQYLQEAGVNVPMPVAGRIVRSGLLYSADIITALIEDATELHDILRTHTICSETWKAIGAQLKKMHNAQVFHGDINVKNVLVSKQIDTQHMNGQNSPSTVYLLDFDKCAIKQGDHWKKANLMRFKRSLIKQTNKLEEYHYTPDNWDALLQGYND